jgi:hypothetical protein
MSATELTAECREQIILEVIRRARPRWWKWPFGWFNICPLDNVSELFHIDYTHRNDAWRILQLYHCVTYSRIPREIRKAIPALIREALSSKINVTCEIEENTVEFRTYGSDRTAARTRAGKRQSESSLERATAPRR